jgi:hypothetical protein
VSAFLRHAQEPFTQLGVEPLQDVHEVPQALSLELGLTHWLLQTISPLPHLTQAPLALQMLFAAHCEAAVHVWWQLVLPLQAKLPHDVVIAFGHAPAPLQEAAFVAVPALQLDARHTVLVPGKVHVVAEPVQEPAQAPLPVQAGCPGRGEPVIIVQVPGVVPLQNWHEPLQADEQQTPSAQIPFAHSPPVWQA